MPRTVRRQDRVQETTSHQNRKAELASFLTHPFGETDPSRPLSDLSWATAKSWASSPVTDCYIENDSAVAERSASHRESFEFETVTVAMLAIESVNP